MIEQLKRVLNSIEEEIKSENSIWDKEQLISIVKPEMEELYTHFVNGKVFFKYGKKQRMLESTYIITDSIKNCDVFAAVFPGGKDNILRAAEP